MGAGRKQHLPNYECLPASNFFAGSVEVTVSSLAGASRCKSGRAKRLHGWRLRLGEIWLCRAKKDSSERERIFPLRPGTRLQVPQLQANRERPMDSGARAGAR